MRRSLSCRAIILCPMIALISAGTQLAVGQGSPFDSAIEAIKEVKPGGQSHEEAMQAMQVLTAATSDQIPQMLQGMDGANSLALNWLRGAIQTVIDKGGELPAADIQAYLDDTSRSHMGRLMAFELLTENDGTLAEKLIPTFLDDPSLPLRHMAIERLIEQGKESMGADAIGKLGIALRQARDVKQVESIVKLLNERDIKIDLKKQLGFLPQWHVAGPFDNPDETGFETAYGPEKNLDEIDLSATYDDGKDGQTVKWTPFNSIDDQAVVDLNELLGEQKAVTAYAYTEFESSDDQDVDIRIGCINGNKVWVNGEEVFSNEIYHVGMMTDQFMGKAKLTKGQNTILLKVCQNDQPQPWANNWMFQLRVCQADGKAVLPKPKPQPPQ